MLNLFAQNKQPPLNLSRQRGALIKYGRGRLLVALESYPAQKPVSFIYDQRQNYLLLMLENNEAIEIARDMSADFSHHLTEQGHVLLISTEETKQRQRVPVILR